MFALKDIVKNKVSSLIIIVMMIISLSGFNIVFNLLFNSFIQSYESKVVSESNRLFSITFEKEQTDKAINKLIHSKESCLIQQLIYLLFQMKIYLSINL